MKFPILPLTHVEGEEVLQKYKIPAKTWNLKFRIIQDHVTHYSLLSYYNITYLILYIVHRKSFGIKSLV